MKRICIVIINLSLIGFLWASEGTIDVLVAYTHEVLDMFNGNHEDLTNAIEKSIGEANSVLIKSGLQNKRLFLHDCFELPGYSESRALSDSKWDFKFGEIITEDNNHSDNLEEDLLFFSNNPYVKEERLNSGADICVLLVKQLYSGKGQALGNAAAFNGKTLEYKQRGMKYGFCVAEIEHILFDELKLASDYTLIHEIAHLLGCGHQETPISSFDYGRGYLSQIQIGTQSSKPLFEWGTIMAVNVEGGKAYYKDRIGFFSNPNVTFKGENVGDDNHDNVAILNKYWKTVEDWCTRITRSGRLHDDEVWDRDVVIAEDVIVPENINLTILPDTNVEFKDGSKIIIECGGSFSGKAEVVGKPGVKYIPSENIENECLGQPTIESAYREFNLFNRATVEFSPVYIGGEDRYKLHWETSIGGLHYIREMTFSVDSLTTGEWLNVEFVEVNGNRVGVTTFFHQIYFEGVNETTNLVTLKMRFPRMYVYETPYVFTISAVNNNGNRGPWSDPPKPVDVINEWPYRWGGPPKILGRSEGLAKSFSNGYQLEGESFIPQTDGTFLDAPSKWSKSAGPGNVTFSNDTDPQTSFSVDTSGLYTLKIDSPTPEIDDDSYDKVKMMIYTDTQFDDWSIVYQDNFATMDISEWAFTNSNWSVGLDSGENTLYITDTFYSQTLGGQPGTIALIDSTFYNDFILSFKARTLETETSWWDDYCVIFNYRNEYNYYFLSFDRSDLSFYKVEGDEKSLIATENCYPIYDESYHDFEIIRLGKNLSVQRDDKALLLIEDATFNKGQIGFGSMDDAAAFANTKIEADPNNLPAFVPYAHESYFNDGTALEWTENNPSSWEIQEVDGSLAYMIEDPLPAIPGGDAHGSYAPVQNISLINEKQFADFEFRCKAKIHKDAPVEWWDDLCVIFGYQDANNYYYAEFTKVWESSAIVKVQDGTASIIDRPGIGLITEPRWYRLGIRRAGDEIKMLLNNEVVMTVQDTTFEWGQIGVGSHDNRVVFDNITVDADTFGQADPAPLVFSDDFNDSDTTGWVCHSPSRWSVDLVENSPALTIIDDDYQQQSGGLPGEYALIDSLYFEDFHFECNAKLMEADPTTASDFGFIFGYQDDLNYYFMSFNYVDDNMTKLYKVETGVLQEIETAEWCYLWDTNYQQIEIIREGTAIAVRSNNATVLYLHDETFGRGKIGVGSFDDIAAFDNVKIYADEVFDQPPFPEFAEDFDDGQADGLLPRTASRWSLVDESGNYVYKINTTSYGDYERSMIVGQTYTDFTVTLKARCDEPINGNWYGNFGVIFGYQDYQNFYRMSFYNFHQPNSTKLEKVINGTATEIAEWDEGLLYDNNFHDISLTRQGQRIVVRFDGVKLIDEEDAQFGEGKIGFGSNGDMATFDDILVAESDLSAPTNEFHDDFEDGYADDWTETYGGSWQVVEENGNHIYQIPTSQFSGQAYATVDDPALWGDFDFSCRARSDESLGGNWYADYTIIFGKGGGEYYYRMNIANSLVTSNSHLAKVENGIGTTIATCSQGLITDTQFHDVRVQRIGSQITVWYDDNEVISVVDSTFGAGKIGIGSCDDMVSFDDVHITTPGMGKDFGKPQTIQALPKTYALSQNYPNPFNPETQIKYQLPEAGDVRLIIYDILGREVRTLVNKKQETGFYNLIWNSRNEYGNRVSTGMYFFRIDVDGEKKRFVKTKKMVLMK